jgi:hypothetical protein
MQETDLERREGELTDDQARELYPSDGRDLASELGKLHKRMAEVEDDRIVDAKQLSCSTFEISNALVNLNVLPIQGIPSQLRSIKDVMAVIGLVLELLRGDAPMSL